MRERNRRRRFPLLNLLSRASTGFRWWEISGQTCVAAYQPIGAASLAASYTNLANPGTYDAAPGLAPTWAAGTGWTFGSNKHLITGLYPTNTWSMIARFSDVGTGSYLLGIIDTALRRFAFSPNGSGTTISYYWGANFAQRSPGLPTGVICLTPAAGYRDGVQDGAVHGMTWGTPGAVDTPIHLGWLPLGYGGTTGNVQAVAIYSTTLSADDVAELTTRMQAL